MIEHEQMMQEVEALEQIARDRLQVKFDMGQVIFEEQRVEVGDVGKLEQLLVQEIRYFGEVADFLRNALIKPIDSARNSITSRFSSAPTIKRKRKRKKRKPNSIKPTKVWENFLKGYTFSNPPYHSAFDWKSMRKALKSRGM